MSSHFDLELAFPVKKMNGRHNGDNWGIGGEGMRMRKSYTPTDVPSCTGLDKVIMDDVYHPMNEVLGRTQTGDT
jgi:hypothetical protein